MTPIYEVAYGLMFVLAAAIVCTVHEMGHYIAAVLFGVNVESVIIGFGREVWSKRGSNGTLWSVRLLPLCGRIHLTPHSMAEAVDGPRRGLFNDQSWWRRATIVSAGPAMNFLLGFLAFAMFFAIAGVPATPTVITAIQKGSPAELAGIHPGDEIIALNGQPVRRLEEVWRATERSPAPARMTLLRDGRRVDVTATPRDDTYQDTAGFVHPHRMLGIMVETRPLRFTAFTSVNDVATHRDPGLGETLLTAQLGRETDVGIIAADHRVHDYRVVLPPPLAHPIVMQDGYRVIYMSPFHDNFFLPLEPMTAWEEAGRQSVRIISGLMDAIGQVGPFDHAAIAPETMVTYRTAPWRETLFAFVHITAMYSFCIGLINLIPLPLADGGFLLSLALEGAAGKERAAILQPYVTRLVFLVIVMLWLVSNGPMLAALMRL